jgi:hypothetical protein
VYFSGKLPRLFCLPSVEIIAKSRRQAIYPGKEDMTPEELYHKLHKRPFEPFRISLTDGRVFDIRYPEINLVGVTYMIIGIPVPNDPDPVADKFIKVALALFDRIEPLSGEPAPVSN